MRHLHTTVFMDMCTPTPCAPRVFPVYLPQTGEVREDAVRDVAAAVMVAWWVRCVRVCMCVYVCVRVCVCVHQAHGSAYIG